jgi:uncharacterized membrane protein
VILMFNKLKQYAKVSMTKVSGIALALLAFVIALPTHAADYSASTTAAITGAGETVLGMFFTNLPIILSFVVAVILTLWGVRWILSQFHRGGKR